MSSVVSVSEKSVVLSTIRGNITIDRTFSCKDIKINNHTFIIIGAATIESMVADRVYYPAICRDDGNLYHLEFFRCKARRWRLEKPDNIRIVKKYK